MQKFKIDIGFSNVGITLLVALSIFTDVISYGIIVPILPFILEKIGRDESDSGILFASYAIGSFVFTPVFGILSDRYHNRKIPMLLGLIALAISTILFAQATTFQGLLAARFVQGVSSGATWTVGLALLADIHPTESLGIAMAFVTSFDTLGFLLGAPIGGYLYKHISFEAPFYFVAGLAILDAIGRIFMNPKNHKNDKEHTESLETETQLKYTSNIIVLLIVVVLVMGAYAAFEPALSLYLKHKFQADTDTIGYVFACFSIPPLCFATLIAWVSTKVGNKYCAGIGLLLTAIALPLTAWPYFLSLEVLVVAILSFTSSLASTPLLPALAEAANEQGCVLYGKVYALFNMATSVGMILGPIYASHMLKVSNYLISMSVLGILLIIPSIFLLKDISKITLNKGKLSYEKIQP